MANLFAALFLCLSIIQATAHHEHPLPPEIDMRPEECQVDIDIGHLDMKSSRVLVFSVGNYVIVNYMDVHIDEDEQSMVQVSQEFKLPRECDLESPEGVAKIRGDLVRIEFPILDTNSRLRGSDSSSDEKREIPVWHVEEF